MARRGGGARGWLRSVARERAEHARPRAWHPILLQTAAKCRQRRPTDAAERHSRRGEGTYTLNFSPMPKILSAKKPQHCMPILIFFRGAVHPTQRSRRSHSRARMRGTQSSTRRENGPGQDRARRPVEPSTQHRPHSDTLAAPLSPPPRRRGAMPKISTKLSLASSAAISRPNVAPLHPKLLTAKLSKASTLPELLSLHETYGDHFNGLHITAFWS